MESQGCARRGGARLLVGAVLAVALISGCGSGGGEDAARGQAKRQPPRSAPLSRSELIARADTFCVANRRAYRAVTRRFYPRRSSTGNIEEKLPNQGYSEAMLALAARLVRQLRSLTPPASLRERYLAYVATQEEVRRLVLDAKEAVTADDGGAYLKAWKTRDAGALERFFLASTVGLRRCSPNPFGPQGDVPRPSNQPDARVP
jgi:hypothetical protein